MANRRFIDFPIAASVGNNDIVLIWQDGLNKQTTKATLLQGSPSSLAGLTDVDISALTNGQILQYNSTLGKWENVDRTDINLSELGDVTIVAPANGQVLVYNSSTGKWENSSAGYVPYTGAVTTVNLGAQSILAGSFVKAGGTAAQFLKANGSIDSTAYGTGSVTSVALTMPTAFSVAGSPITTAGTLAVTGAGTVGQYIRGDGSLADFPATTGGGSSVSYYLNGSVSQGTIGGVAYRELNRTPIFGAGTDISISADGYIASFITDALDPNKLLIPAGNWNFETYFSANSSGGSPSFYIELYKYNGTTFTLIATSSSAPELIAFGTSLNPYFSTLAVPETVLALTDRLALRYYVTHSGRTITLHTENGHLCEVITTFTTGLTALNGLTSQVQFFAVGTSGTNFNISSASDTHTFNLPTASATNRGALSSADWSMFNGKENAITAGTTAQYFRGDKTFQTLNTAAVPELTNLYYTEARVNANTNVAANTAARHNAVTLGTANGLSLSTQVLSLGLASAGVTGALSGTDWSTFNGKQNALTNPVTGTGVSGRVAYWNGTNSITSDADLLFDGSNLTLAGNLILANGANRIVRIGSLTNYNYDLQTTGDDFQIIEAGATPRLTIKFPNGNLGINTTTPATTLEVNGVGLFSGGSLVGNTKNGVYIYDTVIASLAGGNSRSLQIQAQTLSFFTGATYTEKLKVFENGNVVISTSPSDAGFKLDVNGTGRFSGALRVTNTFFANTQYNNTVISTSDATNLTNGFNLLGSASYWGIRTNTSGDFNLDVYGNGVTKNALTILQSTGAAIFSSSVTARTSINLLHSNSTAIFKVEEFSGTEGAGISLFNSSGTQNVLFNAGGNSFIRGGNVGIGTASVGVKLEVFGAKQDIPTTDNGVVNITDSSGFGANSGGSLVFRGIYNSSGSIAASGFINTIKDNTTDGNFGYAIAFGGRTHGAATTERMRITSGGNVLIGTTTDGVQKLRVSGTTRMFKLVTGEAGLAADNYTEFSNDDNVGYINTNRVVNNGDFHFRFDGTSRANINRTTGVYTATSDLRLKSNIENSTSAMHLINQIKVRQYQWNESLLFENFGLIAQELNEILPQYVHKPINDNDFWKISKSELVPLLVKAIQELKQEIDTLKN